jgi:hypothetical protein
MSSRNIISALLLAISGILAGCASNGALITSGSQFSATTTAGLVCTTAAAAKASLKLTPPQTTVVNAGLAYCGATNSGQMMNGSTLPAALIAVAIVLQQAGYSL